MRERGGRGKEREGRREEKERQVICLRKIRFGSCKNGILSCAVRAGRKPARCNSTQPTIFIVVYAAWTHLEENYSLVTHATLNHLYHSIVDDTDDVDVAILSHAQSLHAPRVKLI